MNVIKFNRNDRQDNKSPVQQKKIIANIRLFGSLPALINYEEFIEMPGGNIWEESIFEKVLNLHSLYANQF